MSKTADAAKAVVHLDGCHFFVWVSDGGQLTFDERRGSDLAVHFRGDCERCRALQRGADPLHETRMLPSLPDDAKELMGVVFTAVADFPGVSE